MSDQMTRQLSSIYYDPSNEGSFGGVERLWEKASKDPILRRSGLTRTHVEKFLRDQNTYSLHKQARRNFQRSKTFVRGIDQQWQADLADMQSLAKQNTGIRYLLTVIDVFSKFAWVIPVKDKSAKAIVQAFKILFTQSHPRIPKRIQTDKGKEFLNSQLNSFLAERNIHLFASDSDKKAAVVERFNRTLKHRLWRVFSYRRKFQYDDILQNIVESYNKSKHRSIGMAPVDVSAKNENRIWVRLYGDGGMSESVERHDKKRKQISKTDNMVRVSRVKGDFEKGYLPNWSEEHFHVDNGYRSSAQPRQVYKIKDDEGEEIKGSWYPEELQPISVNKFYIEKVIKTRKPLGGKEKELFVKWKGWPDKFNSWIPESNVE